MIAGEKATVDFDGDGLLRFTVDEAVLDNAQALDDQIANTGQISADGGQVLIKASAAEGVFKNAINNRGMVRAGRIDRAGGKVMLVGLGPGASVLNTGQVDASAASAGADGGIVAIEAANITNTGSLRADANSGRGGSVTLEASRSNVLGQGTQVSATSGGDRGGSVAVLGARVALNHDAAIDVSGAHGGGSALVGGDYQGQNPDVANAEHTFVSSRATIRADAMADGDGGKVVVWADDTTRYHGSISARGGDAGGDGGFVEVSGQDTLKFDGDVDTTAAQGKIGTLLLDPTTLTVIDTDGAAPPPTDVGDLDANLTADNQIASGDANVGANTVSWGAIDSLAATANIVLAATGLVTINDVTGAAGGTITASNLVTLDLTSGSLTITSTTGNVVFADQNDVIRTNGGAITINASAGTATVGGFNTTNAGGNGAVTINSGTGGSIGAVTTGGAALTLNVGAGTLTQVASKLISGSTTLTKQGAGTVTLSETNTYTGNTTVAAGTLQLGASGVIADGSAVVVNGGTFNVNGASETVASIAGAGGVITSTVAATLITGGNASTTYSGNVTGADLALTKGGSGTLTLSGSNTYGGATTINDGVLQAGSGTAIGDSSAVTLNGTATLDINDQSETVGSLIGGAGRTLDLGDSGSLLAAGNINLTGMTIATAGNGNNTIDSTAGTLTIGAFTKADNGDLSLGGGTAIDINGAIVVSGGDLILQDNFTASSNLTASNHITFQGTGTSTFDGAAAQTVTATAGNITDTAGAVLAKTDGTALNLVAGGDIGVSTANRLGVQVSGGSVVTAAATGSDIFMESASDLSVGALTTAAGADTVNIRTTGTANLTLAGPYTDFASDAVTLSAGGTLRFMTNSLTATTVAASFGTGGGAASIDLDVTVAGSTSFSITGGAGASTIDAASLGVDLAFAATGAGTGTIATGLTATYSGIENITSGSGTDTFSGNTSYVVTGANTGTASSLNAGAGVWSGIENITGTAGVDTFTFNSGSSLTGSASGLAGNDTFTLAGNASAASLLGGNDNDTFALASNTFTGAIDGGSGGTNSDSLNGVSSVTVTASGSGTATTVSGGWSNIENINGTAGNDSFTFNTGAILTGNVNGAGGNDTFTLGANATVANLQGGDGDDTFDLAGFTLTGAIQGGEAAETLGDTVAGSTTYGVTGSESGTTPNASGGWSQIENLTGTTGADTFTISNGGVINGTISGLAGNDTFNITGAAATANLSGGAGDDTFAFTVATNVLTGTLDGGSTGEVAGDIITGSDDYTIASPNGGQASVITGGFSNIENLTGTGGTDTFTVSGGTLSGTANGAGGGSDLLTGDTSYTVSGTNSGASGAIATWQNFENLTGTTGADAFTFASGGSISGSASGGNGVDSFTLTGNAGVTGMSLLGGAGDDSFDLGGHTLTGSIDGGAHTVGDTLLGSTTYVVTATNQGTSPNVSGGWANVENLNGTSGADSFTFNASSSLSGTASGLGGSDTFTLAGNASATGLSGGADADTFDLAGFTLTGSIDGGGTGTDTDTVTNVNAMTITGPDTGTSARITTGWSEIENITGTSGADTFTVSGGTLSGTLDGAGNTGDLLTGAATYSVTGVNSGTSTAIINVWQNIENLTGSSGNDTFTFSAGSSLSGTADGGAGDDSFTLLGAAAATLNGGAGNDTFALAGFTLTGAVNGGEGSESGVADTISGATAYTVSAADGGSTSLISGGWTNVESLTGTAGDDTFTITTGSLGATITGGGGTDHLTGLTTVVFTGAGVGTAAAQVANWTGITNITGTGAANSFTFNSGGSVAGTVDGAGGNDTFTLAGNAGTGTMVLLGGDGNDTFALAGFALTGTINGSDTAESGIRDSITGGSTFTVNAADGGTVGTASFSNIENITGTGNADTITFTTGGSLTGSANGGAGDDDFIINGTSSAVALNGQGGDDDFTFTGTITFTGSVFGDASGTGNVADLNRFFFVGRARVVGAVDGGNESGAGDNDVVDFSGSTILNNITGSGNPYTMVAIAPETELIISVSFEDADFIPPAGIFASGFTDSFWYFNGVDDGIVANSLAALAAFINTGVDTANELTFTDVIAISGSTGIDVYIFSSAGRITQQINGGSGVNTVMGSIGADLFTVTSATALTLTVDVGGTALQTSFSQITNLDSSIGAATDPVITDAGADQFSLGGNTWAGAINGGNGTDTLSGGSQYAVTGANSGTSTNVTGGWSNIENLTGTSGADAFVLNAGSSLAGTASGLGGADTFTLAGAAAATSLSGGDDADAFALAGFVLTGSIDGGNGGTDNDTVSGANNYIVTTTDTGTSTAVTGGFSEVENLTGTTGADSFTLNAGSVLSGTADGGSGDDIFFLNGSASAGTLQGGAGDDSFTIGPSFALTGVINGGETSEVTGDSINLVTNFVVTGADAGTSTQVSGGWSNVENLNGTAGADTFIFNAGSSLSGTASGSAGADSFTLAGSATANLSGGNDADAFALAGFTLTGSIDGGSGGMDTDAISGANNYTVTTTDTGTSTAISGGFGEIESLLGTSGNDAFTFNAASVLSGLADGLAGNDTFTLAGGATASIAGSAGDDTLSLAGFILSGTFDGGEGSESVGDTLSGSTSFTVTGADSGIAPGVTGWSNVENLTGTAAANSFTFNAGSSLSGTASGLGGADAFVLAGNASAGSLTGGSGNDSFDLAGFVLTGAIDGSEGSESGLGDIILGTDNHTITGADSGTSTGVSGGWQNIESLTGTGGSDSFVVTTGSLSGTVNGNGGNDTLSGLTAATVTAADTGTAASQVANWTDIDNLTGTAGNDNFTFNAGSTLSGTVNGLGGNDTFMLAGNASIASILAGTGDDSLALGGFVLTGTFNGNEGGETGGDTVSGATTFVVTGADSGTTPSITGGWNNVENLSGTTGADSFTFNALSSLTGTADGLGGADSFTLAGNASATSLTGGTGNDTFDLAGFTLTGAINGSEGGETGLADVILGSDNYTITGADSGTSSNVSGGWSNIESLTGTAAIDTFVVTTGSLSGTVNGNGGLDTLSGLTAAIVTSADTGTAAGQVANWTNIGNLTGTAGNDSFTFNAGSSLSGTASGAAGNDTFTLAGAASVSNIVGGTGDDTLALAGFLLTGAFNGSEGSETVGDSITGSTTYVVTGADSGTSSGVSLGWQNVENLTGTTAADTITLNAGSSLTGTADGLGGADAFTLAGNASAGSLTGGAGDDTFALAGFTLTGAINGSEGSETNGDLITGIDNAVVTGTDAGTSTRVSANWSNVENLTGTSGSDSFTFGAGSDLNGDADGLGGADTFTLAGNAAADNWLGGDDADTFNLAGFSLTGAINGGAAGTDTDTLAGSSAYTLTGADSGTSPNVSLGWSEIENLTGTTAADTFTVNAGALLSGTLNGLGGSDTLTGDTTYTVDGTNAGFSAAIADFQSVENLTGTTGADTFTFNTGANLSGSASGGNGADSFVLNDNATAGSLTGGAGDDTFTLNGFTLTGAIDAGEGGETNGDLITGGTNFIVTGVDAGTSTRVTGNWTNVENLTGTAGADTFTFNAGSDLNGDADGLGGNDTFTLAGNAAADNWLGGDDADTFNLAGFTLTGTINGGATGTDSDTLAGSTTVVLTGPDSGTSPNVSLGWSEIENLTGTTGADTFTINGGSLSGTLDAGAGSDTLTGDTTYTVNAANGGFAGAVGALQGIENLIGTPGADTFNFMGGSLTGTADGLGNDDTFNVTATTSVGALVGGAGNDTFNLSSAVNATLTTTLTGGTGNDTVNFGTPTATPPGTDRMRVIGSIDLGAEVGDTDTIDFSGSDLAQTVKTDDAGGNEQNVTFTGFNPDPALISDGVAGTADAHGVEVLIGNGKGALVGPDSDTFWRITGTNQGTFGDSLANIGANFFTNFNIQAGSANDVVVFDNAGILTGGDPVPGAATGFFGGGGTNTLIGTIGGDTFEIVDANTVILTTPGALKTRLDNITHIDPAAGGATFVDSGNDFFAFQGNANWGGNLNGGDGADELDLSGRSNSATATINTANAQGMDSTTANFAGAFSNIENLIGGSGRDIITLSTTPVGAPPNSIDLRGGSDEIRSTVGVTWVITADDAGFIRALPGASAANQVVFTDVENLTATGNAALTLPSTGPGASLTGTFSSTGGNIDFTQGDVFVGDLGLRMNVDGGGKVTSSGPLSIEATVNGDIDINAPLDVQGAFTSTVNGGQAVYRGVEAGNATFNGATVLAGDLTGANLRFNGITSIVGTVTLDSSTNIFDFNQDVFAASPQAVLSIVPTPNTDLIIDTVDGPGHIAANRFENFEGTLVIGGDFEPAPSGDLFEGTLLSATADYITVLESLRTRGNLMLVGSAVDFSQGTDLEIGSDTEGEGDIAILALGDSIQPGNDGDGGNGLGDIIGPTGAPMRFVGGRVMLAATDAIENSTNMIMDLAGGEVLVAQSSANAQQQVNFNVQSNAQPSSLSVTDTALIASLVAIPGASVGSVSQLFQNARVFFPNPAAILTILQAVAFVDSSLFEEDLSLFGVIGDGIAKSLDQCEDAEGCAPSVTEEQLAELIKTLEGRIAQLEALMAKGEMDAARGEALLAGYRAELASFLEYQQELVAYNKRQEEDADVGIGDEGFEDVFEAEETLEPAEDAAPADAIEEPAPLEEGEELFAPLEDEAAPAAEPSEPADVEESFETLDAAPLDAAPQAEPSAPAEEPAEDSDLEEFDDEFDELEEIPDDALLDRLFAPDNVKQLAGIVRIDAHGGIVWEGDVVLPTLHRRY